MADNSAEGAAAPQVTFKVKTSGDKTHEMTMAETALVSELKTTLSGADFEDVPIDRQRLIYSGRVMKNEEPLSTYKIKTGNTVHLVKSAASNPRPSNPASTASNTVPGAGSAPQIPTNMAAGTANNPLAGLTGARYAGLTNQGLPSADAFGPDGGMSGSMMNEDELLNQLNNPNTVQQMNEMMGSDMFRSLMENHPAFRNNPGLLNLMQTPEMRSMMTNPDFIRQSLRLSRAQGGGGGGLGGGPGGNFPMPGVTDNTPGEGGNNSANTGGEGNNAGAPPDFSRLFNPYGGAGLGGGAPGPNPAALEQLMAMMGGQRPGGAAGTAGAQPGANTNNDSSQPGSESTNAPGSQPPPGNPFASLFNTPIPPPQNLNDSMARLQEILAAAGGAGAGGPGGMGGMGDLSSLFGNLGGGNAPPAPEDNRPPEVRYADQLRQLNDMGFYDFDRNVAALRRSGGSVQGAIEQLLG